jgi:hypothetical protein
MRELARTWLEFLLAPAALLCGGALAHLWEYRDWTSSDSLQTRGR